MVERSCLTMSDMMPCQWSITSCILRTVSWHKVTRSSRHLASSMSASSYLFHARMVLILSQRFSRRRSTAAASSMP